jgi:hypothetical protein
MSKSTKTVHVLMIGGEPRHFPTATAARRFLDSLPPARRVEASYAGTREVSR